MKTIEEMLRNLARSDVTEFAVVSDRLPCVKIGDTFHPVDDEAPSTDTILEMLVSAGGSRYVDSLGAKPVHWTLRIDGVGTLSVRALLRGDIVQARFVVTQRDAPASTRAGGRALRADIDPRGRGDGNFSPPPPPPAAAAALVEAEPVFDFDSPRATPAVPRATGSAASLDFDEPDQASGPSSDLRGRMPGADEPIELEMEHLIERTASIAPQRVSSPRIAILSDPVPPPAPVVRPTLSQEMRAVGPAGVFERFLAQARQANASDLHLVSERPSLLRVAGELVPSGDPLAPERVAEMVNRIVPERLHPTLEHDGSCDFAVNDTHGRCRVNVAKQRTGYKVCVRLIPAAIPTLASLGLPENIGAATHHHQGLILVTGPTGHGKTSTLAAVVDIINRETTHHIITVEDPVEYVHPRKRAMMSQREVGSNTRTFAAALKGSLREDPDVIVVGELRDTETVRMALSASETGHLVIGTMNTPSAAKTIDRLIDLFPPTDQAQVRMTLAGGLRLIVSQRLLPNADRTGLVAACEILPGSISLWSLIRDNKTYQIPSLQQRGKGLGITRFDDSLVDLVKAGRTSLEVAKQWAESPEEMEMTALNKRPVAVNPMQPQPGKPVGEGAKEAVAGILGKAGNLFRKGS
ncbi:MAG TPA: PilT/PilU family type 4a pilus ATPase [Polyangiaceae bacterium]